MPKDTFYRLPREKKDRIVTAAENEFLNHAYESVSINRIISVAGIPRGSFYQYFEDKKDLFMYILKMHKKEAAQYVEGIIKECGGDIFAFMRTAVDNVLKSSCECKMDGIKRLFSEPWVFDMIFGNIMKGDMQQVEMPVETLLRLIDRNRFPQESDEDIVALVNILVAMMFHLIFRLFIMDQKDAADREKLRQQIYREIELLEKHF